MKILYASALGVVLCLKLIGGQSAYADEPAPQPAAPPAQPPPPLDPRMEEAIIAYSQGMAALKSKRPQEAIEKLKQAIILHPRQPQFHYALAQAYASTEQWLARWLELRKTVRLDPTHAQAMRDFLQMWQIAVNKNALDVGAPSGAVQDALGEPDAKRSEETLTLWQYGFIVVSFRDDRLFSLVDLRGVDALTEATEVLRVDLDEGAWRLKQRRVEAGQSTLEYVPQQPGAQPELVTIERLAGLKKKMTAQQLMEGMQSQLHQRFPALDWQMLRATPDDVLFSWRIQSGPQQPAQHEIVRLIAGAEDIHRLAYTTQSIADVDAWIKRLSEAKLEPVSK